MTHASTWTEMIVGGLGGGVQGIVCSIGGLGVASVASAGGVVPVTIGLSCSVVGDMTLAPSSLVVGVVSPTKIKTLPINARVISPNRYDGGATFLDAYPADEECLVVSGGA